MLLVSHSAISIQALCDECLYLKAGRLVAKGTAERVLAMYESDIVQDLAADNAARASDSFCPIVGGNTSSVNITEVRFSAGCLADENVWMAGQPGHVALSMGCAVSQENLSVNVIITDLTHRVGETVQFMTSHRDIGWLRLEPGRPEVRLTFQAVGLRPGTYQVKISLSQGMMHDVLDVVDNIRLIVRDAGFDSNCLYFQPRDWSVVGGGVSELTVPSRGPAWEAAQRP